VNGGRPKERDVTRVHGSLDGIRVLSQVVSEMWLQVGELLLTRVRAFKELQATILFIGRIDRNPDDAAFAGIRMRINLFR